MAFVPELLLVPVPFGVAAPAGPPAGPPANPAVPADGPALGIEPVCGVEAVAREYAAGPVSPASRATTATAPAIGLGRCRTPTIISAAAKPTVATTYFSQGCHDASRASSSKARLVVSAVVSPRTPVARSEVRCCQSTQAPIPTSAPIAGASATV